MLFVGFFFFLIFLFFFKYINICILCTCVCGCARVYSHVYLHMLGSNNSLRTETTHKCSVLLFTDIFVCKQVDGLDSAANCD